MCCSLTVTFCFALLIIIVSEWYTILYILLCFIYALYVLGGKQPKSTKTKSQLRATSPLVPKSQVRVVASFFCLWQCRRLYVVVSAAIAASASVSAAAAVERLSLLPQRDAHTHTRSLSLSVCLSRCEQCNVDFEWNWVCVSVWRRSGRRREEERRGDVHCLSHLRICLCCWLRNFVKWMQKELFIGCTYKNIHMYVCVCRVTQYEFH